MRKALASVGMLLCGLVLSAQDIQLQQADTVRVVKDELEFPDWSDEYLDTVKITLPEINNYSTIGISFGGTFTSMSFNPKHQQIKDFYPGYTAITFTHYEKMFDYLPYFAFQIGLHYGHEGYHFKENKETGSVFEFYKERSNQIKMEVIEMPFLAMIHVDTRNFKFYGDAGLYAGYRMSIERFGPNVDDNYRTNWYDSDIRFDYGLQGGAGVGFIFSPFEFTIDAQLRYGWSSIFEPDSQYPEGSGYEDRNKYYYRFAYPFDIMISAGVHIQLGRRYGKTNREIKREAYEIVYGTNE